jgi:hypothetical protein
MSPELEQKLFEKYPKIFAQRKLPMTQTAMCWGIETGDGWYTILDKLCHQIQHHVDWKRKQRARGLIHRRAIKRALKGDKSALIRYHSFRGQVTEQTHKYVESDIVKAQEQYKWLDIEPKMPKIQAVQVKEKFGTLRFYTNFSDEYIDGLIAMAESMTAVTCQECGKPGKVRGGGWIYVACDEHTSVNDLDDEELDT